MSTKIKPPRLTTEWLRKALNDGPPALQETLVECNGWLNGLTMDQMIDVIKREEVVQHCCRIVESKIEELKRPVDRTWYTDDEEAPEDVSRLTDEETPEQVDVRMREQEQPHDDNVKTVDKVTKCSTCGDAGEIVDRSELDEGHIVECPDCLRHVEEALDEGAENPVSENDKEALGPVIWGERPQPQPLPQAFPPASPLAVTHFLVKREEQLPETSKQKRARRNSDILFGKPVKVVENETAICGSCGKENDYKAAVEKDWIFHPEVSTFRNVYSATATTGPRRKSRSSSSAT